LIVRHTLKLNVDGNEILAGLDAGESVEYLATMDAVWTDTIPKIGKDNERFLTFYIRHVACLP
jgi:hypothetical protein